MLCFNYVNYFLQLHRKRSLNIEWNFAKWRQNSPLDIFRGAHLGRGKIRCMWSAWRARSSVDERTPVVGVEKRWNRDNASGGVSVRTQKRGNGRRLGYVLGRFRFKSAVRRWKHARFAACTSSGLQGCLGSSALFSQMGHGRTRAS